MKRKALYRVGAHILIIQMFFSGAFPCRAAETGESTLSAEEENPALGDRDIRICLKHPDIFKTQLRALWRARLW